MRWYNNAVFYELYVRAFGDDNGDGHGDFAGLRGHLDYLEWLGVDCIWLLPMYPSPLKDDGYDVASYYGIHPTYGQIEDFQITLDEVHRRGMKLIVDLVLNHTSDQHPWFQESRRSKDSPLRDYYVWSPTPDKYANVGLIFPGVETSNWAYDPGSGEYYWHRFYSSQPDLNYDNPAVRQAMLEVVKFWLDMGVDGFRVDAVPFLFEREGTNCESLPETHAYIKDIRRFIDSYAPNAMMLAEAAASPRELLPYFGDSDEFHMCFHFPIMPRLYMALAKEDSSSVIEVLNDTPPLPPDTQWATFLRNHDELNLWLVTQEERDYLWDRYSPLPEQRIFTGIRRRLAPLMDNDQRKIELMYSLLITLPGSPVLYYGDEIGMGDNVSLPDRNGVRTPMQWTSGTNAGFSNAVVEKLYAPVNADAQQVNVESQKADPGSLLYAVRRMIHSRKTLPVLGGGMLQWVDGVPREALCFWRSNGNERFLALHNLSDRPLIIPMREGELLKDVLHPDVSVSDHPLELPPYGYRWLTPLSS
jgi:maltose alpha-D-glucosyltransferase/alpha-amylase